MLISIDENDPKPIYLQIVMQVKEQVRKGYLIPGDVLPSVRELSESTGVNLHTVHSAYRKLRDQGVIILRIGQRAKIAKLRSIPPDSDELSELSLKLRDIITEAFHIGLSKEDFVELFDDILNKEAFKGESE